MQRLLNHFRVNCHAFSAGLNRRLPAHYEVGIESSMHELTGIFVCTSSKIELLNSFPYLTIILDKVLGGTERGPSTLTQFRTVLERAFLKGIEPDSVQSYPLTPLPNASRDRSAEYSSKVLKPHFCFTLNRMADSEPKLRIQAFVNCFGVSRVLNQF